MIDVIANRYAEALFQLSEEENITKEIYNELHDVVEVIKNNKELDNVLKSPLVAKNEKTQLIEALFNNKINNDLKNFLKILVEKGRISSLKSIELTFKELLNDTRIINTSRFIVELAYSFYTRNFSVNELSSTRKLDMDTRNFIINILNYYEKKEKEVNTCA